MWIQINRNNQVPFIRQIYEAIKSDILSGKIPAGDKLPSTRELSTELQVSRNVVLEAFDLLEIEGFIETRPKSGTFVAKGIQFTINTPKPESKKEDIPSNNYIDLRPGVPALDLIPIKKWTMIYKEIALNADKDMFGYGSSNGVDELRHEICSYLKRMRGLDCNPSQIIITSGSMNSFCILANTLLKDNPNYIIEDPLHLEIKKVFMETSRNYKAISVDEHGMKTTDLPGGYHPAFVFVTPSHQYPMGGCLPIKRRIELIEYARSHDCYIIEDDYDSEFRYAGTPVSTVYSLDSSRVIYVGSFSKTLFPTVRIGYMILPAQIYDNVLNKYRYNSYFTDTISQYTMANILKNRILEKHISKMKKIYKKRRDTLLQTLNNELGDDIIIHGNETGLHLVVEFKKISFNEKEISDMSKKGVGIYPVWQHSEDMNFPKNLLVMGYSHLNDKQMMEAINKLKSTIS